jgi:hypothetical protein
MMRDNKGGKLSSLVVFFAIASGLIMLLPVVSAGQTTIPASYKVQGVPLYQQIDARGCGAGALQMVFDYYGPFINQMEIYDAARSGGTALPDMARAAQFSSMSYTAGDRYEQGETQGYAERAVGYAGFYYASSTPWLPQLKSIVAQGYPVIVLVNWLPNVYGPHYRVVVGYDDTAGVLMMNDPWSREFKNDMGYQGSTSQSANTNAWDVDFGTFNMTYDDFLNIWALSTSDWGVPGLAYGAVFVTPWQVQITAPKVVAPGKVFTVSAKITYPCVAPFGSGSFPTFPASDLKMTLSVGSGLSVLGSPVMEPKGILSAAQQAKVSWTVRAGNTPGAYALDVDATGMVMGSLGPWHDYPAYSYQDMIGGAGSSNVAVGG